MSRSRLALLVTALALFPCACTDGGPRVYPVKGQVIINGKPAADAHLIFHHTQGWGDRTITPSAWTESDGTFTMTTHSRGDGAPAGDYKVVLELPEYRTNKGEGPDRMPSEYSTREKTPLTVHVDPGDNTLPPIDVKVTLKPVKAKSPGLKVPKGRKHD